MKLATGISSGFVSSEYLLHDKLGEGGMGVVYRAIHRLTGRQVALKCMRAGPEVEHLIPGGGTLAGKMDGRLTLAQEFQTLASLHHPHIVSVLDYGFDEQRHAFFTMELLEAPQSILQASANLGVRKKVDLLVQLLQALAYLHRRNILHRDVKPSNVLVVDGQVKLVDFGIADAVGASRRLAGTLDYMAPELFLGHAASPSSDLYAVGVLAFEMLTGHFPHDASSRTRFLSSVLGEAADRTLAAGAAELVDKFTFSGRQLGQTAADRDALEARLTGLEGSAAPLVALVTKLLARTPEQRYQDALQVIRELSEALRQPLPVETVATRESFLIGAEFIGREREKQQLSMALSAALKGQGSVVMISGESGVGKSRLTSELRTLALVRSAQVVSGRCAMEGGSSYHLWTPVLRAMCLGSQLTAQEVGILRDVVPDLERLLGIAAERPPTVSPPAALGRLYSTIERLLRRQTRPLLVILEDLQWAEAESLELLEFIHQSVHQLRVLVLGNYREDEAGEALRSLRVTQTLRLERLSVEQIARLSASMLGAVGREPVLVEYLHRQTEGNIFFLIEVVRALAEMAGQLANIAAEGLPEQLLTGGIERILVRRLHQVPEAQIVLLELAAVAGRRLDLPVLQRASGQTELTLWLQQCANAAVLDSQQGDWQFAHDKIRELILTQIPADRLEQLHQQVAQAIEAIYGDDWQQDAVLAYHWHRAGAADKALARYLKAGQAATRMHALVEAREHFAAALQMLDRLPDTMDNRRQRVDTQLMLASISLMAERSVHAVARMQSSELLLDSLREAGEETREDRVRLIKIQFWKGRGHYVNGEYSSAIVCYQRASEIAQEIDEPELVALMTGNIGHALLLQGHLGRCWSYLAESEERLQRTTATDDLARMIGFKGIAKVGRGNVTEGLADIERAISIASDPTCLATVRGYLILCYMLMRDWAAVEEAGRNLAVITQENRDDLLTWMARWLIGLAQSWLGRRDESAANRALARERLKGRPTILIGDWLVMAEIDGSLHQGRVADSLALAQEAVARSGAHGRIFGEGLAHSCWARGLIVQDPPDYDEAERHLAQSVRLLTDGEHRLAVAHANMLWGYAKFARGERDAAISLIEQAEAQFESAPLPIPLAQARAWLAALRASESGSDVQLDTSGVLTPHQPKQ